MLSKLWCDESNDYSWNKKQCVPGLVRVGRRCNEKILHHFKDDEALVGLLSACGSSMVTSC